MLAQAATEQSSQPPLAIVCLKHKSGLHRATVPVLLQSLQLVSGQGGWRQLNQPAQHSGGKPAGCLHAHALPGFLVPAKGSARAQAPPLLLPRRAHGALLPAGLVRDASSSASATVLTEGLTIHNGAGWYLGKTNQYHNVILWKCHNSPPMKLCTRLQQHYLAANPVATDHFDKNNYHLNVCW